MQPYVEGRTAASGCCCRPRWNATDARRMFPCWDEPAFRATFALTATVPADWATVVNMPIARARGARQARDRRPSSARRGCRRTWWNSPPAICARSARSAARRTSASGRSRGRESEGAHGARQRAADPRRLQRLLRLSVSAAEARLDRGPGRLLRRHGELGRDHLQRPAAAAHRRDSSLATARMSSPSRRTRWRTSGTATWSPWAGGTTCG